MSTEFRNRTISDLLSREQRYELWERRVLGYPVWPLPRLSHYRTGLLEADGASLELPTFGNRATRSNERIRISIEEAFSKFSVASGKRDVWVLSASIYRRKDAAGVLRCIFTEHLREQLGERLLFLERNTANLPCLKQDDLLFVDALHLPTLALGTAAGWLLKHGLSAADIEAFSPTSPQRLVALALYGHALEQLYQRLIERYKPQALFVLNSYSEFIPVQRAAKRLKVPLIELQHGIIHHSHPGYVYPDQYEPTHAPDHIVTFGSRFGAVLEEACGYWRGRWSVGGHAWLRQKAERANWAMPDSLRSVVLFSQPDRDIQEQLNTLAPELRRHLPEGYELILKPHPGERDVATVYGQASAAGVRIAAPSEDSYTLLSQARLSVCAYSTVALEALAFPCKSAVLHSSRWPEEIRNFVERGILHPVAGASDIAALATAPLAASETRTLADSLFGIDAPTPDFQALIRSVQQKLQRT